MMSSRVALALLIAAAALAAMAAMAAIALAAAVAGQGTAALQFPAVPLSKPSLNRIGRTIPSGE